MKHEIESVPRVPGDAKGGSRIKGKYNMNTRTGPKGLKMPSSKRGSQGQARGR